MPLFYNKIELEKKIEMNWSFITKGNKQAIGQPPKKNWNELKLYNEGQQASNQAAPEKKLNSNEAL